MKNSHDSCVLPLPGAGLGAEEGRGPARVARVLHPAPRRGLPALHLGRAEHGDGGAAREDDTLIMRVAVKAIQERKATTILTKLEGRWSDGEKKRCTFNHFAFSRAAAEFACEYLRSGSLLVEAPLEAAEAASVIDFLGCDVQPSAFNSSMTTPFESAASASTSRGTPSPTTPSNRFQMSF